MKKSKLIKSLIAFAISVAAVIGCISLVACGGGEDNNAVNSVSLNKPTLSLQVDETETLVATTDPAGATVTWSSSDNAKVEVDQTGKVTAKAVTESAVIITAQAGEKKATCSVTVTAKGGSTVTLGGTFSWQGIIDEMANNISGFNPEVPDKTPLKQDYFTGDNAFLTLTAEASSNVIRGKDAAGKNANLKCVEIKEGALSVTFTGTGTLTVSFASTGGSNTSGMAVKNSAGTCLTGTTTATLVDSTDTLNAGFYQVTGTTAVEVTFNITEAGTYTIWGGIYNADSIKPNGVNNARATRIHTIVMVDNGAQA